VHSGTTVSYIEDLHDTLSAHGLSANSKRLVSWSKNHEAMVHEADQLGFFIDFFDTGVLTGEHYVRPFVCTTR